MKSADYWPCLKKIPRMKRWTDQSLEIYYTTILDLQRIFFWTEVIAHKGSEIGVTMVYNNNLKKTVKTF